MLSQDKEEHIILASLYILGAKRHKIFIMSAFQEPLRGSST
jgi:hypothetical protein